MSMSISHDDLNRFHEFAIQRIDNEGADYLYDLVDQWKTAN